MTEPFKFVLNLSNMGISEEKKKKNPGRPRKLPPKLPFPKKGIIQSPTIDDAVFELFYCNPDVFGKAIEFYLSQSELPLHCKFMSDSIQLLALDRHKTSKIQILIDPTKLNHYYCKPGNPIQFGLSKQYLSLPISSIDTDMTNVKWYNIDGKNDETYMDFYTPKYKITSHEALICCGKYQQIDDDGFDDSDYQIKFQMNVKDFRNLLKKAKARGDQIILQQAGGDYPLVVLYSNANGHAKNETVYEGKDEMHFTSTIKPGEIFNISIQVKYWYPIANAAMKDSIIHISLHKEKPVMTKIVLDDGCMTIRVLTKINDIRQDSDITTTIATTTRSASQTPRSSFKNDMSLPDLKLDLQSPGFKLDTIGSQPSSPIRYSTRSQPTSPKILTPLSQRRSRGELELPE